jgi:hypothetical protein
MEDKLQLLREAFKDENFIQEMVDRLKSREEKKSKNMQRISNFFSDNKSFEGVLLRIISKHDERWADICSSRNVQPHPWEILYAVFNIAESEGKEVDPVDALTENFPSMLLEYREHIFAWTHGQGTCLSIYNKNKELIYRD